MLNVNKKRSCVKVTWHDYVKSGWNLERCAINFFYSIEIQIIELGNPILRR